VHKRLDIDKLVLVQGFISTLDHSLMDLISDEFLMISVAQKLSRFDHRSVELSRSFLLPSKAPCSRPLVGSSQHYKGLQSSMPLKPAKHTFM
jgi:hypothetical protein